MQRCCCVSAGSEPFLARLTKHEGKRLTKFDLGNETSAFAARDAVKALIVANEYLEQEVCDLMQAVSKAFVRGRFKTYNG